MDKLEGSLSYLLFHWVACLHLHSLVVLAVDEAVVEAVVVLAHTRLKSLAWQSAWLGEGKLYKSMRTGGDLPAAAVEDLGLLLPRGQALDGRLLLLLGQALAPHSQLAWGRFQGFKVSRLQGFKASLTEDSPGHLQDRRRARPCR